MNLLLDALAFGAVLSGILVITAKNPVISVLFLISVFINVAGYLVLIGVTYLGLVYIIVYVGAIAILFLFVVIMLNIRLVELLDVGRNYTQNLPIASILALAFFVEILSSVPSAGSQNTSLNQLPLSFYNLVNNYLLALATGTETETYTNTLTLAFNPVAPDISFTNFMEIESIGQGLYTYSTLWLVIASFILLLSMIGPIVLCMNPQTSSIS